MTKINRDPTHVEIRTYPAGCRLILDKNETWHQTYDEAAALANRNLRKEWEQPYHNC